MDIEGTIPQPATPQKANGLISRILTLVLTLLFFLPWFTFKACNMTYEYNGYNTVVFQPSTDIGGISNNISNLDKEKTTKESKSNDFTVISAVSVFIVLLLILIIVFSYFIFNKTTILILSSVNSLLFLIIISILIYDKSQITPEAKAMVGISIEYGLILSFLASVIIIFSNKIESGFDFKENESNSFLYKLHQFFQKKIVGLICIAIIIAGLALSSLGASSDKEKPQKESGLSDLLKKDNSPSGDDLKKKELELKERELNLKEKELSNQQQNQKHENSNRSSYNGKYAYASERYLTASDLAGISKYELKIMRNEIFARHGYKFKTDDMRRYFGNENWYTPLYDDVTSMLTPIEKANVDLIKKFE